MTPMSSPLTAIAILSLLLAPTLTRADDAPATTPPPPTVAAPPAHSPVAGLFATSANAGNNAGTPLPGAAAVVDGHVIPMSDVVAMCLREDGPSAVDRLVQRYVVDRECKRRNIVVSQAEIDSRVELLRRSIAPTTLEEGLKAHHQTRAMLDEDIRQSIARVKLVIDKVPPTKMVHCEIIFVPFAQPGAPLAVAGTQRTEAQAQTLALDLQSQLKAGADFATLARAHSAIAPTNAGDIGILYEGIRDVDSALLPAALALHAGERSAEPIRANSGYYLVQALSTDASHAAAEDSLYTQAKSTYKESRAQFLVGQGIVDLLAKSQVQYFVHD